MVERTFSFSGGGELGAQDGAGLDANTLGAVSLGSAGTDGNGNGGSNSGTDDFTFDSERHISPDKRNGDGSYRRKRQRRGGNAGSTSNQRPKTRSDYSASLDALTNTLVIVHAGLASVSKVPELEIDQAEAKTLAQSLANVLAEFDIQPDPKVQAIVGAIVAAGSIYGPRFYLYNERKKREKKVARNVEPAPFQVVN